MTNIELVKLFNNTRDAEPEYYNKMIAQRLATGKGSTFEDFTLKSRLVIALCKANWREIQHKNVEKPCRCFVTTDVKSGRLGIVELSELPDDVVLVADDDNETGYIELIAEGIEPRTVEETYLIVGPTNDSKGEMIYAFHPGEPIMPSRVPADAIKPGTKLSKAEALKLGFELAKTE